jgi:hypothetical protein
MACASHEKTILKFRSDKFSLGETPEETKSKVDIDVLPEYDSKDTIVYMGSVGQDNGLSKAKYEACSIYFFYGRESRKLGSIYMCFIFPQKITKRDLSELPKELPVLKRLDKDSLKVVYEDGARVYATVDNSGSYKTVRVWMYE